MGSCCRTMNGFHPWNLPTPRILTHVPQFASRLRIQAPRAANQTPCPLRHQGNVSEPHLSDPIAHLLPLQIAHNSHKVSPQHIGGERVPASASSRGSQRRNVPAGRAQAPSALAKGRNSRKYLLGLIVLEVRPDCNSLDFVGVGPIRENLSACLVEGPLYCCVDGQFIAIGHDIVSLRPARRKEALPIVFHETSPHGRLNDGSRFQASKNSSLEISVGSVSSRSTFPSGRPPYASSGNSSSYRKTWPAA